MKIMILVIPLAAIVVYGCDSSSSGGGAEKQATKVEDCIPAHNPYNDAGGHDAGFNWAIDTGGACDGNSDSFNEGCEEYYRQLNEYNECIANANNSH